MIISNATPLIAYARIDRLDLLRKVVGKLVISVAVEQEILDYSQNKPGVITKLVRFHQHFSIGDSSPSAIRAALLEKGFCWESVLRFGAAI
jgi:predicted nucleic acid-binding protein